MIWESEVDNREISFSYLSVNGDNGYPGNHKVAVIYQLTDYNDLIINYKSVIDKITLFNPIIHVYFNLNNEIDKDIRNFVLTIKRFSVIEIMNDLIPTGNILDTVINSTIEKKIWNMHFS